MEREYYAHYRKEDQTYQTLKDHIRNTADLSMMYCSIDLLKRTAWLAGFYHDIGKARDEWQEYFENAIDEKKEKSKEKIDHSTLGGAAAERMMPNSLLAEMIETTIYNHHGIVDSVSVNDGIPQIWKRRKKYMPSQIEAAASQLEFYAEDIDLKYYWKDAKADIDQLGKHIIALSQRGEKVGQYGNKYFFLGMCERMLLSSLMDGDFRDTADFMKNVQTSSELYEQDWNCIWDKGIQNLEERLNKYEKDKKIDICRAMISMQCKEAAMCSGKIYRLSVPTGAGKTLASLRFALHHAKYHKKRHIFYVAPFRSILEQNADVIRSVLGLENMVLEHHSDVICENEEESEQYERLIENWDEVPIIVTTAVQFFNTLFKARRRNLRRFHSLANSVIIMDEVQAFPVKLIQLFNMAANFLVEICNTTIVLCTATQPLLDRIRENKLLPPVDMVKNQAEYEATFQRVEFYDDTRQFVNGASGEQIAEIILEKEIIYEQVLVIVNTKWCAEVLYQMLEGKTEGKLFHLSTKMCAMHRNKVLNDVKAALEYDEKVICISTQLVEAGVDFSFRCVIRSLAGLDNLIQAAGRCNRNGEVKKGHVHLVYLASELENVSKIRDIKKAQDAMRQLLIKYHRDPSAFDSRLDSKKAIQCYYQYYFYDRQDEMNYPSKVSGVSTNLVDLLSINHTFARNIKKVYLKQAFNSAGEKFQVIEDSDGVDVVVPYEEAADLLERLRNAEDGSDKKGILRKLQRFTVHLSNIWLKKLGSAVYGIEENRILVLTDGYYSMSTGVVEHPVEMSFLCV